MQDTAQPPTHDPLDTISIGRPITRGPITLFPLYTHAVPAPEYVPGPEAVRDSILEIEEVPTADVPTLVAVVGGELPVLLVEGEAFLGGQQDRVLNTSVVLTAGRTEVPVSCVEAGRWNDGRGFVRAGWHAPRQVRATLSSSMVEAGRRPGRGRSSDQGAVWASVDQALHDRGAASDTAALRDAMGDRPQLAARAERAAAELAGLGPLPGQTGVVVAVGRTLVTADVFDRPSTLRAYWGDMMRGLAVESDHGGERPPRSDMALGFVRQIRHGDRTTTDGVGLGRESRLTIPGQIGATLEWDGALVHMSTYALAA